MLKVKSYEAILEWKKERGETDEATDWRDEQRNSLKDW
jgi:hypothetical protein